VWSGGIRRCEHGVADGDRTDRSPRRVRAAAIVAGFVVDPDYGETGRADARGPARVGCTGDCWEAGEGMPRASVPETDGGVVQNSNGSTE